MGKRKLGLAVGSVKTSLALSLLLATAAVGGCWWDDDLDDYDYGYDYYYPYSYYYPTDLSYSSYYYYDDWAYSDWYYAGADSTVAQTTLQTGIGSVIRALARGESVCPGQVTVTPKMSAPACQSASTTSSRSGATIVFSGCKTSAGGTLDGTIDLTATRTANEQTCSANTRITLSHTATITNLSYTAPGGNKVVIPEQTDTGTNSYTYGQLPTTIDLNSTGRVQVYAADGTLSADLNQNGTRTVTYTASTRSYAVSGTVNVQDARSGARATLVGSNVSRSTDCCHPVGGSVVVNRTGGSNPGEHTWTFGPTCGQAAMDGAAVTPSTCL